MPQTAPGTDRPRRMFGRFYTRISPRLEDEGLRALRTELLAGLTVRSSRSARATA